MSFVLLNLDVHVVAEHIRDGSLTACGLPKTIRFDRVDASNIVDVNSFGLKRILEGWAPLLNKQNPCSTILGYFVNRVSDSVVLREMETEIGVLVNQGHVRTF